MHGYCREKISIVPFLHHYSISDLQYFFISLLAQLREIALVMSVGALFHSLAVSLLKLIFAAEVLASSFQSFLVPGLTVLPEFTLLGLNVSSWTGYEATWVAFQASVNLISAASWLTEDRLYFSSSEAEVMWSLSVTLSSILSILFWATWISFMSLQEGSSDLTRTWLHSWSPYLNLDIQRACASWIILLLGIWLATLLMSKYVKVVKVCQSCLKRDFSKLLIQSTLQSSTISSNNINIFTIKAKYSFRTSEKSFFELFRSKLINFSEVDFPSNHRCSSTKSQKSVDVKSGNFSTVPLKISEVKLIG